jgi:DNA polymerase III subunit epsilon
MKVLVTDTETSGLPLFNDPSEDPRQPHLCEVAGFLFDDKTFALEETLHYIVQQDGFDVDPKAFEAHGITRERSMDEGLPETKVLSEFMALHAKADLVVAHNWQFDQRIFRIALKRFDVVACDPDGRTAQEWRDEQADKFKAFPSYCTMKTLTPIMALPATDAMRKLGRGSWKKSPSLAEAYDHFFHESFDGAHSAKADAWACARVYFMLTRKHDIGKMP